VEAVWWWGVPDGGFPRADNPECPRVAVEVKGAVGGRIGRIAPDVSRLRAALDANPDLRWPQSRTCSVRPLGDVAAGERSR